MVVKNVRICCHEMFIPCCTTVLFLPTFFDFSSTTFEISLCLCAKVDLGYCWFVVPNGRIPLQNGNLLLRIEALHGIIILYVQIELIEGLVLIIHSDSRILCLIISPLVPLRALVGLRPPSKTPAFSHSVSLCLLYLSLFCPRHNSRRCSLA